MSIIESTLVTLDRDKEVTLDREKFDELLDELKQSLFKFVPPGHFYSPIPNIDQVIAEKTRIWKTKKQMPGIELNHQLQLEHLQAFFKFSPTIPFNEHKTDNLRYYYNNDSYSYADAITLHSMIRTYKPRRIIEVGSGHSSCVMLDTNALFFNYSIDLTFIEPYPEYFFSLISEEDKKENTILNQKLQEVPISVFERLEENDILFIDSSHISKINSDVNYIFFEILPRLKKGVIIHFHDIFFPFEYPYEWIIEGRAWNEIYILRAFMQYNEIFKVLFMSTYAYNEFKQEITQKLPLFLNNPGGNFWIKKIKSTQ